MIGGAGFLGANLVRKLVSQPNVNVTVLDSLEPRLRSNTANLRGVWDKVRFVRGSMTDDPLVSDVVQGQDVIFNCAAQTSHPLSLQDPLFDAEINCLGNLKLLEAVRHVNDDAVVVYASSSTVVGKSVTDVVDEDHPERPLDIYSANKGVAEKYYRIYNRVHDLRTVVLRFANLYGPYGKGSPEFGFVNHFIHQAWSGDTIKIFGSGGQTRNVLYVEDAAEAMLRACQEKALFGEAYFAVSDEHKSVAEIAQAIVRVLGRGQIQHVEWPDERRRIEIDHVKISAKRLRSVLDWAPRNNLDEGLARTKQILEGRGG